MSTVTISRRHEAPDAFVSTLTRAAPSRPVGEVHAPAQMRQGDLLLDAIVSIPPGVHEISFRGGSVALMPAKDGAVGPGSHDLDVAGGNVRIFGNVFGLATHVSVTEGFVWLRHHEHEDILVPPGKWVLRRQRDHVAVAGDPAGIVRSAAD